MAVCCDRELPDAVPAPPTPTAIVTPAIANAVIILIAPPSIAPAPIAGRSASKAADSGGVKWRRAILYTVHREVSLGRYFDEDSRATTHRIKDRVGTLARPDTRARHNAQPFA
jgi:hypothetical protein